MFLMASINDSIANIFLVGILAVLMGYILKRLHQPYLVGYIIIGVCLGQHGFDVFENEEQIQFLGEIGIILLFFFIGMEISLPAFVKQWRVAILGTLMQIIVSVGVMVTIGYYADWSFARSIVLGFMIALSSSAVVIRLLEEKNLLHSKMGKDVLSILLTQDIAIAPILIITALLGGQSQSTTEMTMQILGAVIIISIFFYLYKQEEIQFSWLESLEKDHEMQVFMAIVFCAAGALLMGVLGLSPALGAFVGGIVVHAAKETDWIHDNLHPFRIIFVAVFFISVGAQIDLIFLKENIGLIVGLMFTVFVLNQVVNAIVLKVFGSAWQEAATGGALLAQIGEMSFLVCFTAYNSQIISEFGYNVCISLVSLTLLCSPLWIGLVERLVRKNSNQKSVARGI
ncbi:MAG: CPA2 family monovalent cation:H+ antiporter-2 [Saprospiraceae bacterium]|jgi:CPA2 family monovalent cation:H+ antiporter-2